MPLSLTAQQTLGQFGLVVLGNLQSSSDVDGRTFVGGTLTGNGNFAQRSLPASAYAGLTVLGNATAASVDRTAWRSAAI